MYALHTQKKVGGKWVVHMSSSVRIMYYKILPFVSDEYVVHMYDKHVFYVLCVKVLRKLHDMHEKLRRVSHRLALCSCCCF